MVHRSIVLGLMLAALLGLSLWWLLPPTCDPEATPNLDQVPLYVSSHGKPGACTQACPCTLDFFSRHAKPGTTMHLYGATARTKDAVVFRVRLDETPERGAP